MFILLSQLGPESQSRGLTYVLCDSAAHNKKTIRSGKMRCFSVCLCLWVPSGVVTGCPYAYAYAYGFPVGC